VQLILRQLITGQEEEEMVTGALDNIGMQRDSVVAPSRGVEGNATAMWACGPWAQVHAFFFVCGESVTRPLRPKATTENATRGQGQGLGEQGKTKPKQPQPPKTKPPPQPTETR
jgi:hypothetical protein